MAGILFARRPIRCVPTEVIAHGVEIGRVIARKAFTALASRPFAAGKPFMVLSGRPWVSRSAAHAIAFGIRIIESTLE